MAAKLSTTVWLLLLAAFAIAQSEDDEAFFKYLIQEGLIEEASLVHAGGFLEQLSVEAQDSVHFALAKAHYQQMNVNAALPLLDQISFPSALGYEPFFIKTFLYSHQGQPALAVQQLQAAAIPQTLTSPLHLQRFSLLGNALLLRDYGQYQALRGDFSPDDADISGHLAKLDLLYEDMRHFKRKSSVVAVSLSTVVPGLGKVYAGKGAEGVSAFLRCAILGGQALEAYLKKGTTRQNPRFWAFAPLFSIYYIGNIWGSAYTVKNRRKFYHEYADMQVLYHMHRPIRRLYQLDTRSDR